MVKFCSLKKLANLIKNKCHILFKFIIILIREISKKEYK